MSSVTVAFELIKLELEAEVESLNSDGANMFQRSDYDKARAQIELGLKLREFTEKVEALEREWVEAFSDAYPAQGDEQIEAASRKILSASKSPKTILMVRFRDGDVVAEKSAAETLVRVLEKIGFDKVAKLGIMVNGENIVSLKRSKKYSDHECAPYFIKTHSSTSQKAKNLEQISNELGLDLEVTVI